MCVDAARTRRGEGTELRNGRWNGQLSVWTAARFEAWRCGNRGMNHCGSEEESRAPSAGLIAPDFDPEQNRNDAI